MLHFAVIPGMTLPTGVSDFLLECLDMETTLDCSYTTTIDSTSSYSSPEIFRDETGLGTHFKNYL